MKKRKKKEKMGKIIQEKTISKNKAKIQKPKIKCSKNRNTVHM